MGPATQADKTHTGTLVEIALARSLRLADGATLDYTIASADVDCEFSSPHSLVIPLETHDKLMLVVMPMPEKFPDSVACGPVCYGTGCQSLRYGPQRGSVGRIGGQVAASSGHADAYRQVEV